MAVIKAVSSKAGIGQALDYVTKEEKTEDKGGNTYQSSFTADTGTYRLCADKVVCKRVYEVKRVLLN